MKTLNQILNIIITTLLIATIAISLNTRRKINKFQSQLEDIIRTELIYSVGEMNRNNK